MAITENQLNIANKSYTNKDFEAIYTELLGLARQLSNRGYDPASSTEADPFVVLLKLTAFVGDKINYNIDKETLERFLISCTQRQSMQEILNSLGYRMGYYKSATTNLTFQYRYGADKDPATIIKIASGSKVGSTSEESDIQYITLEDITLTADNNWTAVSKAIQGTEVAFEVLGSNIVQLENLDENNRLYFPQIDVAENMITITGGSYTDAMGWRKVENLNTQAYGNPVFTFEFDSKINRPYIQFPDWISVIIGEGLSIKYFQTRGAAGNVAARALRSLASSIEVIVGNSVDNSGAITQADITVFNPSATTNGADPETLDESYQGYKRIVGTLETLVTCRDFANAIYTMLDSSTDNYYVSNVQVSDRRTDLNAATSVLEFNPSGDIVNTYPTKKNQELLATEVKVYGFSPIRNTNWSAINLAGGYNQSYLPVSSDTYGKINNNLSDYKAICFTLSTNPNSNDIISLENRFILDGVISTTEKVDNQQQIDILANINSALAAKYNARKVNFGEEIAFEELLHTIETADKRIKNVALQEPKQETYVQYVATDGYKTEKLADDQEHLKFLAAQNLFAGRIAPYVWDNRFTSTFREKGATVIDRIKYITTEANIKIKTDSNGANPTILGENEALQFLAPAYKVDGGIYGYGIAYSSNIGLAADSATLLSGDNYVSVWYEDDAGETHEIEFKSGDVVYSKLTLESAVSRATSQTPITNKPGMTESRPYFLLGVKDELCKKTLRQSKQDTMVKMYWIRNNDRNVLFSQNERSILLEENEYLFIADKNLASFVIYSAGTTVIRNGGDTSEWATERIEIDLREVEEKGLDVLGPILQPFYFTSDNYITIQENDIITLTKDAQICNVVGSSDINVSNNTFEELPGNAIIKYKEPFTSETKILPTRGYSNWKARGLLDINAGPDVAQTVQNGQSVTYYTEQQSSTGIAISSGKSFKFSELIQRAGGEKLDLSAANILAKLKQSTESNLPDISIFQQVNSGGNDKLPEYIATNSTYRLIWDVGDTQSGTIYLPTLTVNHPQYLMTYITGIAHNNSITLTSSNNRAYLSDFNHATSTGTSLTLNSNGLHIIKLTQYLSSEGENTIIVSPSRVLASNTSISIIMKPVKIVGSDNPALGLPQNITINDIFDYMKNSDNFDSQLIQNWNMCATLDYIRQIDASIEYPALSPQGLYDKNNVANKWVLPKIDFENINLRIGYNSKK